MFWTNIAKNVANTYDNSAGADYQSKKNFFESENLQYFYKMYELCKENNAEFFVTTSNTCFKKSMTENMRELCEQNDVLYLDVNEHIDEIKLDFSKDINDIFHFNLSGAIKWSDYLGKFIKDNYELPDRRKDNKYKLYEQQREIFAKQKEYMYDKICYTSLVNFKDFIKKLKDLDTSKNIVMFTFRGNSVSRLDDEGKSLLMDLGLNMKDMKDGDSYAAIIYDGKTEWKHSHSKTVSIEKYINGISCNCNSGGNININDSYIMVDNQKKQAKIGINIVIWNLGQNMELDSSTFSTNTDSNPKKQKN